MRDFRARCESGATHAQEEGFEQSSAGLAVLSGGG